MIKEAIKYVVELGKTDFFNINGQDYSNDNLRLIKDPIAEPFRIHTLTGIVDYIKQNIDKDVFNSKPFIHIKSYNSVFVMAEMNKTKDRDYYIEAAPSVPKIEMNYFHDIERFNIMLQSSFVRDENIEKILKVTGNIKEEQVMNFGDDGVSQQVTAKAGIARVENVVVPSPVLLSPFRTFPEIKQPTSKFILRMKDGPKAALFEADGGAWKIDAIRLIKEYLQDNLEDVVIIA